MSRSRFLGSAAAIRVVWAAITAAVWMSTMALARAEETHRVVMQTTKGEIVLSLDAQAAPVTVGNFIRYINAGAFDGGSFYRTVSPENDNGSPLISVIQGGARADAQRFQPIAHERTRDTGISHTDGAISMARLAVGTAQAEFFICVGDQPDLDWGAYRNPDGQGFAAFGQVIEGMETVRAIHNAATASDSEDAYTAGQMLSTPVSITSVRVTELEGSLPDS